MLGHQIIAKLLNGFRRPKDEEIEAFIAWASEHAVFIDSLNDSTMDIERLSTLDKLLEDKRIVYLGEEDHWVHEKSDYRLLMLRYLISRGWRYIGEELGWSDGIRINRYLETGDESYLERIATYGYRGAIRTDRDDRPTGILKDSSGNYPESAFKAEQLRLTKALRSLNEKLLTTSGGIHFFGFDIDALAGGGYEDITELLSFKPDSPVVRKLQSLLARVPGETVGQEIHRLNHILDLIRRQEVNLQEVLDEKQHLMLRESLRTLRDSFDFVRTANPAMDYASLNMAMAAREQVMHRHIQFILSQMAPADKLVLMGHNRHLAKHDSIIKNSGSAPPGGKRVPSVGNYINDILPEQVFSIWMLHDHGVSSQPLSWLSKEYISRPGSLNAILAKVGSVFLLPTTTGDPYARLLDKELNMVGLYNIVFRTVISKQADLIFFVNEVTPLKS